MIVPSTCGELPGMHSHGASHQSVELDFEDHPTLRLYNMALEHRLCPGDSLGDAADAMSMKVMYDYVQSRPRFVRSL
jgi:hypothetical protein